MIWLMALLGAICAHVVRRFTPHLMKMKDRRLPFRWPGLEILGAVMFALIAWRMTADAGIFRWYLFAILLLGITSTDYLLKLIPDSLSVTGSLLGIVLSTAFPAAIINFLNHNFYLTLFGFPTVAHPHLAGLVLAIGGASSGFIMLELIRRIFGRMVGMEVMGIGDSFLMMMIGAFLGPQMVIYTIMPACLLGVILGGVYKLMFKVPHSPFGPALGLGGLSMLVAGEWIVWGVVNYQLLLEQLHPAVLLGFSLALVIFAGLLVVRIKRKRDDYTRQIEEDYQKIEEKIEL